MVGHFETLLSGVCANPNRRVSELPLLGPAERNTVFVEWNASESAFPDGVCIHQAFEAQVTRTPNSIAVRSEDGHMTYQQLNAEAGDHYVDAVDLS